VWSVHSSVVARGCSAPLKGPGKKASSVSGQFWIIHQYPGIPRNPNQAMKSLRVDQSVFLDKDLDRIINIKR